MLDQMTMPSRVRPAEALTAYLHHLVLGTPDPAAAAAFYQRAMGFTVETVAGLIIARGLDRVLAFVPGAPKTLAAAGYAVADRDELMRLRERIARAAWGCEDADTPLFTESLAVPDPDGNRLIFGVPAAPAQGVPQAAAQGASALVARLQHVVVSSREPDRIVRFFTDVLGFTLSDNVVDGEGEVRTSFLRCSHEHHSFAVFKAARDGLDHHCYETADWNMIRDWSDHLASERIVLQWGPGRHGPGNNLFIFMHDPDGNWVEISAELEVVDHARPVGEWVHEQRTLNSWGQAYLRS